MNLLTIAIQDDTRNPQPGSAPPPPVVPPRPPDQPYLPRRAAEYAAGSSNYSTPFTTRPTAPPDARRVNPDLDEAMGYARPPAPPTTPYTATMPTASSGATSPGAGGAPPGPLFDGGGYRVPVPVSVTNWPTNFGAPSVPSSAASAAAPPAPPGQPTAGPDVYRFKDAKDRVEAGPTYKAEAPTDLPPRPPRAEPVPPAAAKAAAGPEVDENLLAKLLPQIGRYLPGQAGRLVSAVGQFAGGAGAGGTAGAAGAAGAAAAGLESVAAAAGPVGATLLVAKLATDAVEQRFNKLAGTVDGVGRGMQRLAQGNAIGLFTSHLDAAAKSLDDRPWYESGVAVKALAGEMKLASASIKASASTVDAFVALGRERSIYDARLAAANAAADVRRLDSRLREADRLGGPLSRVTENASKTESNINELLLPIKETVAEILGPFTELASEVTGFMKEFAPVIRALGKVLAWLAEAALVLPISFFKALNAVIQWLKRKFVGEEPAGDLNSMWKDVFGALDNLPQSTPAPRLAPQAAFPPVFAGF